jgi:hypothetical protein
MSDGLVSTYWFSRTNTLAYFAGTQTRMTTKKVFFNVENRTSAQRKFDERVRRNFGRRIFRRFTPETSSGESSFRKILATQKLGRRKGAAAAAAAPRVAAGDLFNQVTML